MAPTQKNRPPLNPLLAKSVPAPPVKAAAPNPNQIMLSSTTGHVYLRFPFDAEIVRFINEQLADSTYIEGTTDSALHPDGRPAPVSAKAMLYRLAAAPADTPSIRQLVRQHAFSISPRAIARLRELAAEHRVIIGANDPANSPVTKAVAAGDMFHPALLHQAPATPAPKRPSITGLSGRQPQTASEITCLKIQVPRPEDSDLLLAGGAVPDTARSDDGLYDTIMDFPGAEWIKGKKGQSRGYFRVAVTHDTPKMVKILNSQYGLSLSPELPRAIAERIGKLHRDLKLSRNSAADLQLPVPQGLDYLPYQKAGIAYAARKGNALIADEPGLGKTIQAVGVSNCVKAIRSVLIVVPATLKINWEREWQKWCVKGLTTGQVTNRSASSWPTDAEGQSPNVVVINYDLVEAHKARLTRHTWDLMIVDEAHALKNDKAKRTQLILGHGKKEPGIPRHRTLLLTGTPILSRPKEIWTLAHALDPEYFSNRMRFALRYCAAYQAEHGWNMDGASNLGELQRELRARIMVRRLKANVLSELPPKTRQIIPLENGLATLRETHVLKQAAQALKDIQRERALLDPNNEATYRTAAARLTDMETAVFEQLSRQRKETALAKIPQVMELVEQALNEGSGKLILFAHHREVVEAYQDALNALFIKQAKAQDRETRQRIGTTQPNSLALVYGPTPKGKRQAEADRFQTDPKCTVFLGSIGAAGVGITLTAATKVLFAELDWVPGIVSQAEDRAHRIGQLDNVLVWHAVVDGSIDARMVRRLIEKQKVLDSALDDEKTIQASSTGSLADCTVATRAKPGYSEVGLAPPLVDQSFVLDRYAEYMDSIIDSGELQSGDQARQHDDQTARDMAQAMSQDNGYNHHNSVDNLPLRIG